MKKKKLFLIIGLIIIILILVIIKICNIGVAGTTFYTVSKGECNSPIITYNDSSLNDKGECKRAGYYIDNNKVNINIGSMNCGNSIKIETIKTTKDMNVYIKAKEKKGYMSMMCLCSPSLNITFSKKVNSVTLENEKGMILSECA